MEIYLENYDSGLFGAAREESQYQHEAGRRLVNFAIGRGPWPHLAGTAASGAAVRSLNWQYGPSGKPFLAEYPEIYFNLSHTAGLLACALGRQAVGIDAEGIRDYPKALLRKMTEGERAYILGADEPNEAFMRVWTMKEAWVKLTGEGLSAIGRRECIPGMALPGIECRQLVWQARYVITAMEYRFSIASDEK